MIVYRHLIKTNHGYARDFDGNDYLWTQDKSKAWRLTLMEVQVHGSRIYLDPNVTEYAVIDERQLHTKEEE